MSGVTRRRLLQGAAGGALAAGLPELLWPRAAAAAPDCSSGNPIVLENRCTDSSSWSSGFQLTNYNWQVGGFPTATTVDRGQPVPLKLFTNQSGSFNATLRTYRLGWYGGAGGRLIDTRSVSIPHDDATGYDAFGRRTGTAWPVTTLPGSLTDVSGVYLVKVTGTPSGGGTWQNHIVFIVRDDARPRDVLVVMPTNTWQAYNAFGGKSLYYFNSDNTALSGFPANSNNRVKAAKVSFDRPHDNVFNAYNWVLRTEFPLLSWLERQGVDVAYTDDIGLHSQPGQLLPDHTKVLAFAGHGEYWSQEMRDNVEAARDAGTHIASFSANTAYWKVRLEDANRTLVCFKTIEGSQASGSPGVNDYGPGNAAPGQANSARGTDNQVGGNGSAADHPEYATTTWRDTGAANGTMGEPAGGRVGLSRPESSLFGVLYIGDDDRASYGLHVPAGAAGSGELSDHRAWRHTTVTGDTLIGADIVGWEWDAIPRGGPYAPAANALPAGIKRLAETDMATATPNVTPDSRQYLQDLGRAYGSAPPSGQPSTVQAITYSAASGALVFAAGTMQWSWGLAPHYMHELDDDYQQPRRDSSDVRIQQATANILADMGVKPETPEGIVLDPPPAAPAPAPPTGTPASTPSPGAPDTAGPRPRLWRAAKRVTRDGRVRLVLASPTGEHETVSGYVVLRTADPVLVGHKRRRVEAARASFRVRAGARTGLAPPLSSRVLGLLRRHDTLRLVATIVARDPAGHRATTTVPIVIHRPARRRARRS